MKIDIENPNQILSHILLNDKIVAEKTAKTKEWIDNETLTATVFVNGIEISAKSFEDTLEMLVQQINSQCKHRYDADNFDARVDERAKQIISEYADNAVEKMQDLINTLDRHDDFIKPYWERDKQ